MKILVKWAVTRLLLKWMAPLRGNVFKSASVQHVSISAVYKKVPSPLTRTRLGEAGTEVGQSNFPSIFLSSWLRLHKKRQINREKQAEVY